MSKSAKKPPLRELETTAVNAAMAAGRVIRKYFQGPISIREKQNASLVTNADVEAEQACVRVLLKKFPDFSVLAEESEPLSTPSLGRWIIDPLDGTTNFVHGFPMFCVSIAAEWEGQVVVGVIYHPILREMVVAVRGKGARLNGKKIHISKTSVLEQSLLTTGFTYQKQTLLHHEMEAFEQLSRIARAIRRPGSAALDLAYTGRGIFDGFWERNLSPWDVAAGSLIVEEAGGKVTDFQGNPFTVQSKQIVASNGVIHDAILRAISGQIP